ncbi:hypothetical protein ACLPHM_08045 [Paenalcaligenes sp. Me131]|uniref:hypothetical protein n=1 Tax=Paenalcaligenes sp. Me131 TaxID=3392636 RepID=UPI003D29EF28
MSSRRNKALDAEIRIELLRARAAIERDDLRKQVQAFNGKMQPANLFSSVLGAGRNSLLGGWGSLLFSASTRYPLLLSLFSSMLGGVGGKKLKTGAVALIGWRLFRLFTSRSAKKRKDNDERSDRVIGP